MKIAYSWLKEYIDTDLKPEEISSLLTDCGLEVEAVEKFETVKGGLAGIVIGEVKTKEKHPDADRLNITTVDIGTDDLLNIVCGAANVAVGQKVLVATIGAMLYPTVGEPFEIKKSKIRGQLSEGMICAEDEIGLGNSHEGIMVLPNDAKIGTPASKFFKIIADDIFEIGLTPNRADAASHIGVARDLVAVLNCKKLVSSSDNASINTVLKLPNIHNFEIENTSTKIEVEVQDSIACPRYSGLSISGITVKESPAWLKNKLKAIGVRTINNIVDVTNFILHEMGQPLHAFDADKIKGNKIIVKKVADKTKFKTLDEIDRQLFADDLMICNADAPMCIAGVFGGIDAGVNTSTKNIFLESAYFNATTVRKSAKRHALKTDASFRFERGTDPNITVYALQRAAILIKEVAGGVISSEIIDIYPLPIENFKVPFSFEKCDQLIGKHIDIEIIKNILLSLGIEIEHEGHDALLLSVPPFKVDVQREQDVIEEVLRIYGYNNVETPIQLNSSLAFSEKPDKEKIQNIISDFLTSNGFSEIMCLSLTKKEYTEKLKSLDPAKNVRMMNPLSGDLEVMRQTPLYSGLEVITYNQNRKNSDLKIFEFAKTYLAIKKTDAIKYVETKNLSLFITGTKKNESWNSKNEPVNFFMLKGIVEAILERLGIKDFKIVESKEEFFLQGASINWNKKTIVEFGAISNSILKFMDIKQNVLYANFNWEIIMEAIKNTPTLSYAEVPRFPEVKRDLSLLIDKAVEFEQLEQLAYQSEKNILKRVNLFDVYEGEKLPADKKSYALSFILQDENATLTDKQIEKVMEKLIKTYQEKIGAEVR
jgi:phenylalanyl-tRNA synthetase beta chain